MQLEKGLENTFINTKVDRQDDSYALSGAAIYR
jgi:hypothetical protein